MVQASPETIAIWKKTRRLGSTPSIFIEDYHVNSSEEMFEVWLYRQGFRPSWDNFLGKTEILEGLDADTFNEYYHDPTHGFRSTLVHQRRNWTWGNVAAFASNIKHIKRFVRSGGYAEGFSREEARRDS